jgi:putative flippase GtrA
VAGLVVNFFLSEEFVFGAPLVGRRGTRFAVSGGIGLVGLTLLDLLMLVLVEIAGLNYLVAKVIATAAVYCWNYLARRAMYATANRSSVP